jgi:nitrogenase molybdenum-iron protein alpha/beta subunit
MRVVYCTCIIGIIGDDVDSVCKRVTEEKGITVFPVHSEGFKGTKKDGYNVCFTPDAAHPLCGKKCRAAETKRRCFKE